MSNYKIGLSSKHTLLPPHFCPSAFPFSLPQPAFADTIAAFAPALGSPSEWREGTLLLDGTMLECLSFRPQHTVVACLMLIWATPTSAVPCKFDVHCLAISHCGVCFRACVAAPCAELNYTDAGGKEGTNLISGPAHFTGAEHLESRIDADFGRSLLSAGSVLTFSFASWLHQTS